MGIRTIRSLSFAALRARCLDHEGVALLSEQGGLTYAKLRERVAERTTAFLEHQVGAGDVIMVRCGAVDETLVSIFAGWGVGATVVPVDVHLMASALDRVLARVQPRLIQLDNKTVNYTQSNAAREPSLSVARPSTESLAQTGTALVLFTSGSSGEPKGVMLGARGILHNIDAILEYLPVAAAGRIGLSSPLYYSYGLVGQALTTLAAGATLINLLARDSTQAQVDFALATGVAGLSSVPTHLRKIGFLLKDRAQHLPLVFCGIAGATLDEPTHALLADCFDRAELFHQYGLTEASPRVTALSSRDPRFARGSVGRPLRDMALEVRDEFGAPLASGTEGHLFVHSPSTMLGYWGEAEATARSIGADGWLRTGDRATLDAEGYVYVAGRADGVVKCGGERVGLDGVASALRTLAGVTDAAAVALPHPELGHAIVGFVEPVVAIAPLRAALRELLAPAARPSRVIALSSLPRTSNGKLAFAELRILAEKK